MSYSLEVRHDDKYSLKMPREQVHKIIQAMPDCTVGGRAGFKFQRGEDFYMEVDVESVSEDGDNLEENEIHKDINCIRFHIPAAYTDSVDEGIRIAKSIADAIGWTLVDPQADQPAAIGIRKTTKPWWKLW